MSKAHEEEAMNVEKLADTDNFQIWKFQVKILLQAQELYETVTKEKGAEAKTPDWIKKDAKAQRIITATVERKPLLHLINCKTSYEMSTKLESIYEKDAGQQKCNLMQQFFSYSFDKTVDIATHVAKLEGISCRLKALDVKIDDNMLISKILVALPEQYKHFLSAWESTARAEQTLENLTSRLLTEEARNNSENESSVAFKAVEKRCFKCDKIGHLARYCKKRNDYNNNNMKKCFNCGKTGHYAQSCNKKVSNTNSTCSICKKNNHLEKDCFFRTKVNNSKMTFLAADVTNPNRWIVDSGTTSHMVIDTKNLKNTKNISAQIGVAKKNESMKAEKVGEISFGECNLKNVIHVPELSSNLLSVNAITNRNGTVIFRKDDVLIKHGDEVILSGKKNQTGLYEIELRTEETEKAYSTRCGKNEAELWHKRMGHLSKEGMKKLIKIVDGVNITNEDIESMNKICEVCLKSKQTRHAFNGTRIRGNRPLELIHTDLCGPIDPHTWDGKKYFITFLDDYTNYLTVYLLKNKYEVPEILKEYVNKVEAQKNAKVSRIRCDNGREYTNYNLQNWCKSKGIEMDFTTPYSPQLNGKAERLNRTLVEKARALLFESKLTKSLWCEAIYTSAHLFNRSPTTSTDKTPMEKWENRKPNLKGFKVFGCKAYAKVLTPIKKLDERTKGYNFVGYSGTGYRLWDKDRKKIIMSRDVEFDEKVEEEYKEGNQKIRLEPEDIERNENEENNQEGAEEENTQDGREEENDERIEGSDESVHENITQERNQELQTPRRSSRPTKRPDRYTDSVHLTYIDAITGPDQHEWKQAITDEKKSLEHNQTWTVIDEKEANGCKPLTSKWVFKIKDDGRYKARLVIRGCEQKYGIDYDETYSPVVSTTPLRILLALSVDINTYKLATFDVKTAFLHGELDEDIYMLPPEGYDCENKLFKLNKTLYGLKQASLKWNQRFSDTLKSKGFTALKSDHCIWKKEDNSIIVGIYVDDGIILGKNEDEIEKLISDLEEIFDITVNKQAKGFIGLEIKRDKETLDLTQNVYTDKILQKFGMSDSRPVSTPKLKGMVQQEQQSKVTGSYPYREAIGSLLYLSNKTRPDLTYAVNYGSRYAESHTTENITDIKRVFRYLNGSRGRGIRYKLKTNDDEVVAFCDSDFAGDIDTRKSTTGYVIMYKGGPISWNSTKQKLVTLSSTEAEYIAACECTKELLYIKTFLEELLNKEIKAKLYIDNQSTIALIKNGANNKRSKHIDIKYHFVHEVVKDKLISIDYCATDDQIADLFTKPLGQIKFNNFANKILD